MEEVEQAGRHGGGDGVPNVGLLGGGASVDVAIPFAPCFFYGSRRDVGSVDETQPGPESKEWVADFWLGVRPIYPLYGQVP